jgi:signal transduction histidine kinase/CheY-like chemotaxis protein
VSAPLVDLTDPAWASILPDSIAILVGGHAVRTIRSGPNHLDEWFHRDDHDRLGDAIAAAARTPGVKAVVQVRGWSQGNYLPGWCSITDLTDHPMIAGILVQWHCERLTDRLDRTDSDYQVAVAAAVNEVQQALTDALPVALFELNEHEELTYANPLYQHWFHASDSDVTPWLQGIHDESLPTVQGALRRSRMGTWFHERVRLAGVDEQWVEIKVTTTDSVHRHVGVAHDITTQVSVEREVRAARDAAIRASTAKSEFLANMSHEIRTPLNGVIGMATLLLDTPMTADQRSRVVTLREAGEHLLDLVNDLLDFAKVETGKLELEAIEFSPIDVITSVVSLHVSAGFDKGVRLRVDADASMPRTVVGDPNRLRQVLSNLVGNAIKFTPAGSVTIRITAEQPHSPTIRFEVVDTGIGIDADAQARIFEPFEQAESSTTRRFGGTGLGLPISRQLVELMGGLLTVASKPAHGSTFWFTIPFASTTEATVPVSASVTASLTLSHVLPVTVIESTTAGVSAPVIAEPVTMATPEAPPRPLVLLVEDNIINQKVACGFLDHLGYNVLVANDGLEGLEMALNHDVAAILMDCQMPRMDGYEATRRIRADREGYVPIVALTAGAMPGDRERCLDAGMDDYLSKPIDVALLDTMLRRVCAPVVEQVEELLDQSRIGELQQLPGGDGSLFDEAVSAFCEQAPRLMQEISELAINGEFEPMTRPAHTLTGMSASVGATRLASVARRVESLSTDAAADLASVAALLSELQRTLEATSEAFGR